MANAEALAKLDAGRDQWNSFQKHRQALRMKKGEETPILDLTFAHLEARDLSGRRFERVDLSKARLSGSNLRGVVLSDVNLSQADIQAADLSDANLENVDFNDANLAGATLLRASGICVSFINANLTNANLSLASLNRAHFDSADLSEASLVHASLAESDFSEASLRDANLRHADLAGANLQGTDLRGAQFESTNLDGATIYRTVPSSPDLFGALNVPSSELRRYIGLASGPGGEGITSYYDPPEAESTAVRLRVLYVTDRVSGTGRRIFGIRQSEVLSFGVCEVSVPKFNRPIGKVPRPSLWRLEFRENLTRHVVILDVEEKTESDFYLEVVKSGQSQDQSTEVLLFVHGYNVSFEDGVRRAAQLAYDLNFRGTPILYSWASQATLRGYPVDLANNEKTCGHLARFLCQIRNPGHLQALHLISHSMGCRAVCHAVTLLPSECPDTMVGFKNVIFVAPDVHSSSFREVLPRLTGTAERVTLYFCPRDRALRVAEMFHDTPRAGQIPIIANGLDTIDASAVSEDLLHHALSGDRSVLSDIFELLEHGTLPDRRFALEPVDGSDGRYFRIKQ